MSLVLQNLFRSCAISHPGMGWMAAPEPAWAFQGRVGDGSLMTGPLTGAEGLGARLLTVGEGQVLGPGSLSEGRGQQRSLWSYGIQECLDYRVGAPLDPAETAERAVEHDAVAFPDPQCLEVMGEAIPGDGPRTRCCRAVSHRSALGLVRSA